MMCRGLSLCCTEEINEFLNYYEYLKQERMNYESISSCRKLPADRITSTLRARGIESVLADNNVNAVARPYADHFVKVDILDKEAVRRVVEEEKVDFLITVCADQILLTASKVSEELGLPCYIDYDTATKVSDKGYMKDIFMKHDIPSSKHAFMAEIDMNVISKMKFPLVVKPVDAYSSKGVRKVTNQEELETFLPRRHRSADRELLLLKSMYKAQNLQWTFRLLTGRQYSFVRQMLKR